MYYTLTKDGNLVGITYDNPLSLDLSTVSVHEMSGEIPNLNIYAWDDISDSFVKISGMLSRVDFILRFTATEWAAAQASTDVNIRQAMAVTLAAEYVDTKDMRTQMFVGYCAMIGLITNERVAEVLA